MPDRPFVWLLCRDVDCVMNPNAGGDYKSQVLAATDIVQLVGASVKLVRKGRDFWGCCPFHSEKSPSFKVSPERQFYYCFGCKEKGNAIDFVMKRDRVEFVDALRTLGQAAGIEMQRSGAAKEKYSERQGLLDAHSAACSFFEKLLAHPREGAAARQYLEKRGITAESVRRFQIGLAPDAWDGLLKNQLVKKFTPAQLAAAGLVKRRERGDGFYDTFRNRLMFPIRDESGRVIAFGGRAMPGSEDPAKYLNSPETPLFSKGRCVFGLDLARPGIVESRAAIVVEGYTDVVVSHQCGISQVVSVLGTAMTEQHVSTIRRFADKIVLLFDADAAGDTAVDRAVGLFLTQPVEIGIASMPAETDPDEFVLKEGPEEFRRLLANAADALTYKWKQLVRRFEGNDDLTARQKAVEEYLQTLAAARGTGPVDPLRWGQALARVSRLTEVPVEELNRRFRSAKTPPRRGPQRPPGAGRMPPDGPAGQPAWPGGPGSGGSGSVAQEPPAPEASRPLDASGRAERWILGILLIEPGRWMRVQRSVHVEDFTVPLHRGLAEAFWEHQRHQGEPVFNEFLGQLGSLDPTLVDLAVEAVDEVEALSPLDSDEGRGEDVPDRDRTLQEALGHLERARRLREEQKLLAELRRTSNERRPGEKQEHGSHSGDANAGATAMAEAADDAEVALLKQLQETARRPDLRRV